MNLKENPCQKVGSMGKKKNREMLFAIAGISTLVDAQLYVVTERRQFFHSLPSIVVNSSCFSPAHRAFAIFSVHFYVYRYPFSFFLYLFYFYILHSHHFFDIIDYRHICSSDKVLSSQLYFIRFRQICLSFFRYLSGLTPTFIIEPFFHALILDVDQSVVMIQLLHLESE